MEHGVKELERCHKAGLKGALIWQAPHPDLPFHSSHYDKFWAAAQDLKAPVSLHILTGHGYHSKDPKGIERYRGSVNLKLAEIVDALFDFIFYGVLERHPGLQLVSVENESGWIPFMVQQWDCANEGTDHECLQVVRPGRFDHPRGYRQGGAGSGLVSRRSAEQDAAQELLTATREHAALHGALARLEPLQRQLIALAFFRAMSHQEIAAHARLLLGSVKTYIRMALAVLRECRPGRQLEKGRK